MAGINRFLDDTQITTQDQPIEKITQTIEQNKTQIQPNISIKSIEGSIDKKKAYLDIIEEYRKSIESSNSNIEKIETKESETKKIPDYPIYDFSRGEKGKVIIEPRKKETENVDNIIENKPQSNNLKDKKLIIENMIQVANKEILRVQIELDIHIQIIRNIMDKEKRTFYEAKIKSFQDYLEYNQKRKYILEKMLSGG